MKLIEEKEKKILFAKIPNELIGEMDGYAIKVYAKLLNHCHGKKTTCYMMHETIMRETGIKSSTTITKTKKALQKAGWTKVTKRPNTCDLYTVKKVNKNFTMMPYDLFKLPANLLHLYLYILMACKDEITTRKIAKIKDALKITDIRTLNKMVDELQDLNLLIVADINDKSAKNPAKKYVDTWQMVKINHVICDSTTMYFVFPHHVIRGSTTMYFVIPNHVIRVDKLDLFKKDYLELNFVKYKNKTYLAKSIKQNNKKDSSYKTKNPECPLPDNDTNTDSPYETENTKIPATELDTKDTNKEKDTTEDKEIFVDESNSLNESISDESLDSMSDCDFMAAFNALSGEEQARIDSRHWNRFQSINQAIEPPSINRKKERAKNPAYLGTEDYHTFLDAKKNGFDDLYDAYAKHEMQLWDQSKCKVTEDKFYKEMFINHPIAQHFKKMSDVQRQKEIELLFCNVQTIVPFPVQSPEELKRQEAERQRQEADAKARQVEKERVQREMEEQAYLMNADPEEYQRMYG